MRASLLPTGGAVAAESGYLERPMRRLKTLSAFGFFCMVSLLGATSCSESRLGATRASFDIQGHRGARGLAPENTLAAFARAIAVGATTLELDVAVTRDGSVVVAHDAHVSAALCLGPAGARIDADAPPHFRELTLAQVKMYDCGSLPPDATRFPSPPWTSSPGERIPTLSEVFELAAQRSSGALAFNIETKIDPSDAQTVPVEDFVAAVVGVIRAHGMVSRTTLQSFDWRALVIADALEPQLAIAALVEAEEDSAAWHAGIEGTTLDALARLGAQVDILSPASELLTNSALPGHIDIRAAHQFENRVSADTRHFPGPERLGKQNKNANGHGLSPCDDMEPLRSERPPIPLMQHRRARLLMEVFQQIAVFM